ncbi:hypothetical protein AGOR_G00169120 [Albula goreensis]|uniref:Heat shock factor-binding protein 1 n=1 Tax=Albula goreensis TaxID=1534307 RepID=A0A8T3D254_9TELE|nr:hypothetical protein AGOR_G00169120 [Albula goreensis]
MSETDPKSVQDLTAVVQTLLQQMQDKFQTMSDQIIGRNILYPLTRNTQLSITVWRRLRAKTLSRRVKGHHEALPPTVKTFSKSYRFFQSAI